MGVTGRQGPRFDSSPVPAAAGTAAYQRNHVPWFRHTILWSLREAHTVSCAYSWRLLPALHRQQARRRTGAGLTPSPPHSPRPRPARGGAKNPRASVGNRRNRRRNLWRYSQVCGEGIRYHPLSCPEHLFEFITKKRVDRSSTGPVYHRLVMPSIRAHSASTASRIKRYRDRSPLHERIRS